MDAGALIGAPVSVTIDTSMPESRIQAMPEPHIFDPARAGVRAVLSAAIRDAVEQARRLDDPSDDEAVHDFRVSVRRLRTFLRAFDRVVPFDDDIQLRLKELTGLTNVTRDAEAHTEWLQKQLDDPALDSLERNAVEGMLVRLEGSTDRLDGLETQADRVLKGTSSALAAAMSPGAGAEGTRHLDVSFGRAVAEVLDGEARRLRKRLGHIETEHDVRRIHRARLSEKRLRYVLELVAGQLDNAEAPVESLKNLQDTLGELHDIASLGERFTAQDPTLDRLVRRRREELFTALEAEWISIGGEPFFDEMENITDILREA